MFFSLLSSFSSISFFFLYLKSSSAMDECTLAHVWYALIVIYKWFDYKYRIFPQKKEDILSFSVFFFYCLNDWTECFIPATLISKRLRHMAVFLFGIFSFFVPFHFLSNMNILQLVLTVFLISIFLSLNDISRYQSVLFLIRVPLSFRINSNPKNSFLNFSATATYHIYNKIIVHYVHFMLSLCDVKTFSFPFFSLSIDNAVCQI